MSTSFRPGPDSEVRKNLQALAELNRQAITQALKRDRWLFRIASVSVGLSAIVTAVFTILLYLNSP
jgi:type IV secretory pathway component VirB8